MRRRLLTLFISVTLMMTLIISSSAVTVSAAKKYDAPYKVVEYFNEYEGEDPTLDNAVWKKADTDKIKYNSKGDVTAYDAEKFKWDYKSGKPAKVVAGGVKFGAKSTGTYKKGKLKSATFKLYNKKGKVTNKGTETYKYKNGWINKISGTFSGRKYSSSYTYTFYSNKTPKKVTEKYKYDGETFKVVYSFNKKGLLTSIKTYFSKTEYDKMTYTYKFDDKGRVTETIIYDDGMPLFKNVYKYDGSTVRNKKTYMAVINAPYGMPSMRDVLPSPYPLMGK